MASAAIATVARGSPLSFPKSNFSPLARVLVARSSLSSIKPHLRKYKAMASSLSSSETAAKTERVTAPYGSWKSPITADVVSGASKRLDGISVDGDGRLLWLESRPSESGRSVLVKEPEKPGEEPVDVTPKEFAVRTLCQEYGGGAFSILGDTLVFSNYKDQRLYKQSLQLKNSPPLPITPDYGGPSVCYADGVFDSRFGRYVTVREDRREDSLNPTTMVVAFGLGEKDIREPKVLISGNDFYAFPRMDPKGEKIAWIEWGHPNMPWDKAELWVGYISEAGDIYKRVCVAGRDPKHVESPTEPKWSPKGELFFITDRQNGFWNLYKWWMVFDHGDGHFESLAENICGLRSTQIGISGQLQITYLGYLLCFIIAKFEGLLAGSYEVIQSDKQKTLIACNYR